MGDVIRIPPPRVQSMDPVDTYRHLVSVHGVGRRTLLREYDRGHYFPNGGYALRLIIEREHFIRHLSETDHDHREEGR